MHKLFEADRQGRIPEGASPKVRGIASFGHLPVDGKLMDALPKLEIICNFGVGVDQINLDDAKARKIIVTNTPDVLNECVADTALALVMNTLRKLPQSRGLPARRQVGRRAAPTRSPPRSAARRSASSASGRIGEAIAKRAMACGMKIRYHNRNKKDVPYPYDPDAVTLAKNSNVLMVVTPGGAETRDLVGAKVLDALGPQGLRLQHRARLGDRRAGAAALPAGEQDRRRRPRRVRRRAARAAGVLHARERGAVPARRQRHASRRARRWATCRSRTCALHFSGKPVLTRVV